ncbi:beta-galactosidase GalA [Hydrotalea sandarakina]|jgi:beta-galactosidase|uniref:Arabinogalactan endo-beta-1,4-galactanase n=1 Tax=Hydrotalea sandarakina TaxID=1004304 RepID=A0A2W7RPV8_9BACT|nr:beta-galactosidase GalA [Hydrotalea sandarakina]PZX62843.1 beta-galactosidase [Hydrotalea sandarakina]
MYYCHSRKLLFVVNVVCYLFIVTSSFSQQHISIDTNWKFHFGNAADASKDFNYSIATVFAKTGGAVGTAIDPKFNDSSWRTLNLPHDWAVELPFVNVNNFDVQSHGYKPVGGLFPETSIGWYRKHIWISAADSGKQFQLQFDGIFRNANIWINGIFVGNNMSGYVGAYYNITNFLKWNSDNVIVVRVDATQYEGWFYEGAGIYRHVWLNMMQPLHFATNGVYIQTKTEKNKAIVLVNATIHNDAFQQRNAVVYSYVTERNGKMVATTAKQPVSIAADNSFQLQQSIPVNNPRLWSLNDPYLYRVTTIIQSGNQVLDSVTYRIGIRTIRFDAEKGFFLNNENVKIHGANNHQDHAGIGTALPDGMQYYRIRLLKEMGVNAYRTSHNAPTPELLDACDSLGMLVLDEQRLLNSSPEYLHQFETLIKRDRNHPAVFLWSIGNEEGWIQTTDIGKRIATTLIEKQKQLDPSRTCTYAADLGNVWHGVNEVIPIRGFNYRQFAVADYHKDHPQQPIVGTEMGSTVTTRGEYKVDSVRGYLPDEDITAPWWASTAEAWWKLAANAPYWMGGFVWTGFDYRGEPTPFQWPNINSHFGVMDVCGFPKNIYYYYKSWWSNEDVLHIAPHWNWLGQNGTPIDVWVYSNANDVELFLNGKSLGTKIMPVNGHLQWSVPYEPGILKAVAHRAGRTLNASVETTGLPAEVVLSPSTTTLVADGTSVAVMNISLVDHEGRAVPNANNMIRFSVTGDAKIIGVGNGDPSSHEPDKCIDGAWQRSAFNGKCQFIIQAGTTPGLIKVTASAEGLWPGSTEIISVSPKALSNLSIDNKYTLSSTQMHSRKIDKIIGADISFLPQLEAEGRKFYDGDTANDAIQILKHHGFNFIRLRMFNNPANDSGYAPGKGFCDLAHTVQMAKRIKAAGLQWLLDFHYSDTWADPGKQFLPAAWENLNFTQLKDSVYAFTRNALLVLKNANALPSMVQVGNEINHGILWPVGNIQHPDSLAQLLNAGIAAVKSVDPSMPIMLHIALGGQNDESVFFLNNMLERGVHFDVIGLSYYPKWHGTLNDLAYNLNDLVQRYQKDVIVVEYSAKKEAVNDKVFQLPNGKGKGTFIWEPLNTWEAIFDKNGHANTHLYLYDTLKKKYLE